MRKLCQQRHRQGAFSAIRPHAHRKPPWKTSKLGDQSRLWWPESRNIETRNKVLHDRPSSRFAQQFRFEVGPIAPTPYDASAAVPVLSNWDMGPSGKTFVRLGGCSARCPKASERLIEKLALRSTHSRIRAPPDVSCWPKAGFTHSAGSGVKRAYAAKS